MEIKTKGVSFNLDDPDQLELYKHSQKRSNFSSYVKRLIQRDMEGTYVKVSPDPTGSEDLRETLKLDQSLAEGLI